MRKLSRIHRLQSLAAIIGAGLLAATATMASHGGIHCTGGFCAGTNGDDHIVGSGTVDEIHAYKGGDTAEARTGEDLVFGGRGRDLVVGQGGWDAYEIDGLLRGVEGRNGRDRVEGSNGRDVVRGNGKSDRILGNQKDDWVFAWNDAYVDKLYGGSGDGDRCYYTFGVDEPHGCELHIWN